MQALTKVGTLLNMPAPRFGLEPYSFLSIGLLAPETWLLIVPPGVSLEQKHGSFEKVSVERDAGNKM